MQKGLREAPIDVPDGEEPLPVMAITSIPPSLATIWTRYAMHVIVVVKVHQDISGLQRPQCHSRLAREPSGVKIEALW